MRSRVYHTLNKLTKNPIALARAQLGLTQKEFAERIGTSLFALSRWEKGDIEPAPAVIREVDRLLFEAQTNDRYVPNDSQRAVVFASAGANVGKGKQTRQALSDPAMLEEPRAELLGEQQDLGLWGNGTSDLASMLVRHEDEALTRKTPHCEEISAGKNTYTYDAHTYHTKVPPQGIAALIKSYLPDGGLVLDPFAGSGMTGVAARYVGADVVLNELSPAASFIANNFTQMVDPEKYRAAVAKVIDNASAIRSALYTTSCRECGNKAEIRYTVWSYELECNHCREPFLLWDHCRKYGNNVREHKLLKKFSCPNCGNEVNKSYLKRLESKPVFVGYKCCSKQIIEHPISEFDLEVISQANQASLNVVQPLLDLTLPDGSNLNQPKRHGLDTIRKFYTPRNFVACSAIWEQIRRIEDRELAYAVAFTFTSLYQRVTRLSEYRFWGGSGNTANFNVPHISNEANVFVTFERKAKSILDHYVTTAQSYSGNSVVRTGSATDMSFLPDNSVDLIFTDPPFGANINYSEMNLLWEVWLGTFTETKDEAIVNKFQQKDVRRYEELMSRSLTEACRVLRPGHWMVLVFMNSSEAIWDALRKSITASGFSIEKINIFDKQHGTFKQFVSNNAAGADLMLHCRKSQCGSLSVGSPVATKVLSIAEFLRTQGDQLPISRYVHVQRRSEIDYRTLYSRYLATAIQSECRAIDFAAFREKLSYELNDGIIE